MLAARFLRDKGYEITHANYRCRFGEIDIIARDGPYIVFVEVKTRRADALYAPAEAVTREKRSGSSKARAISCWTRRRRGSRASMSLRWCSVRTIR